MLVFGFANSSAAFGPDLAVSIALGTKLTCSAVFVVGQDAREFLRTDAYPFTGVDWDTIEISLDREAGTLELSTPDGSIRKKAVYNGSQGCTLLPDGETGVFFTPTNVESTLADPTTELWPMGDVIRRLTPTRDYDEEALEAALDMAFKHDDPNGVPLETRAFIVLHKGQIVAERYARGYDMQQDGVWLGERILPEGWVDYIRIPAPASEGNYGGLWWINVREGVPAGFYASGARGQRVMIIPSHDLVIVRMGHSIGGGFGSHFNEVTAAVTEAFETRSNP